VFIDASEHFWSSVVTQTTKEQLQLHIDEQRHEPIAFLGSSFKHAEKNWTTFAKEGFAIFQAFDRMDYLLAGHRDERIFTYHRNLLFFFAPLYVEPALGRHIVSKVPRWALYLSRFNYAIEHVSGENNVFSDIFTRWTRAHRRDKMQQAVCSLLLEGTEQFIPAADSFIWPTLDVFREAQHNAAQSRSGLGLVLDTTDGLWKRNNCIWIPSNALEPRLKVMVVSHSGTIGHRGQDASLSILSEDFWWDTMKEDVAALVRGCLHCLVSRTGEIIPRPLSHALHGCFPNEVVHMDFLYMGAGKCGKKYILIIRDDFSAYVWLWPTDSCTAEAAAEALGQWPGVFGGLKWLVSDQASQFKNKLLHALTDEIRVGHHFTTAYSPWANGTVERVCREVLRACRALLGEWRMSTQDWPAVTESIQSVINHAPLKRLGLRDVTKPGVYRSPLEVFTGHKPVRPLMRALPFAEFESPDARMRSRYAH